LLVTCLKARSGKSLKASLPYHLKAEKTNHSKGSKSFSRYAGRIERMVIANWKGNVIAFGNCMKLRSLVESASFKGVHGKRREKLVFSNSRGS